MPTDSNSFLNRLKLLNDKLSTNQKISILACTTTILTGLLYMVLLMNQEDYQVLYSNINVEEAGTVIAKLKDLKVPYKLSDSGKTIKVPVARIDELRIQLASEGLPQSGKIGFEIFDKTNLGMTEFLEKVSYKRALEGELSRTILSLKEISQVRVHLVLPKESLFEEKSEPTKASVVLKLNAGKQLNETMISGIVNLVSSAVEGLTPQNVTVVDSAGRLLSAKQGSTEATLTNSQLELKARTEKELMGKVINILEPVVGQGRVKADTSVVLNFNRSEQTEEKYDPQATAIRSQQKSQEQNQPAGTANATGIPGTTSNQPNVTPINTAGRTATSSTRMNETTNYEVSKLVRHTVDSTGDIKKLSVAVIVDDALKIEKGADGNVVKKTVPRTPEELKKIKDLVSAAIGIDVQRGDLLTVENIAFGNQTEFDEIKPTFYEKWKEVIQPAIKYGAFLLLFIFMYFLLIRPVTRKVFAPVEAILTPEQAEQKQIAEGTEGGPLALEAPKTVKELEAALDADGGIPVPDFNVRKADILKQRIIDFVQREPENVAQLLRVWLTEEGN